MSKIEMDNVPEFFDFIGDLLSEEEIERGLDEFSSFVLKELKPQLIDAVRSGKITGEDSEISEDDLITRVEQLIKNTLTEARDNIRDVKFLVKNAEKAKLEGRYDDAVEILEMFVERYPDLNESKVFLANAYMDAGRTGKAIDIWEELHASEKDNSLFSLELAIAYLSRGWYKKAIRQFERTIDINTTCIPAWEGLVLAYRRTDKDDIAMQKCIEAISILGGQENKSDTLYLTAFELYLAQGKYDHSGVYLTELVNILERDDEYDFEDAEEIVDQLLDILFEEEDEALKFLPQVREIVDLYEDFDDYLVERLEYLETFYDIKTLSSDFPFLFDDLFMHILNQEDEKKDDMLNIASMECSVLTDLEGYTPYINRIAKEYPRLYALNAEFFNLVLENASLESELRKRLEFLLEHSKAPLLRKADGTEIKPQNDEGAKRREGKKIGANEQCPCGSGKKYKKCCRRDDTTR